MNRKPISRISLMAALLGATAMATPAIHAQDAEEDDFFFELEEIVVTARKRAESLQDVPASITAVTGNTLQKQGTPDLTALAPSIPNFSYASAPGASDILIIRGLGTVGSGPHFEPAIGQVFNGYFASRSRLGRAAFIDVAQVEILRGPQGAIIGKNTSLGAINLVPNKPTDDFEASIFGSYDFADNQGYELEGVVSSPITDNLRARFAVNYKDKDGFVENTTTGDHSAASEDLSTRLIVDAQLSDSWNAEFFWQRVDFDREGKPRELSYCGNPDAVLAAWGDDCTANGTNVVRNFFGFSQSTTEPVTVIDPLTEIGEPFDLKADIMGLTMNVDIGDVTLTSLTGYQESEITDTFSSDMSPLENEGNPRANAIRTITTEEDYEQFSQELRLGSDFDGDLNFIAGVFYLSNEIDYFDTTDFSNAPPGPPSAFRPARRTRFGGIDSKNVSLFGEIQYQLSDDFSLEFGSRYTREKREGFARATNHSIFSFANEGNFCALGSFLTCNNVEDEFTEKNLSWNTNLQWRVGEDSLLYASVATGFKSGGFNLLGGLPQDTIAQSFIFGDEQSTNYEIGGKHTLSDGALVFNWTVFRTEIDDLQVSSNDPNLIAQTINNAAGARSQGLELDTRWAPTNQMNFSLAAAWLDTEYTDFNGSPCYSGQTEADGCVGGIQDLTGAETTRSPELQVTFDASYTNPIGDNHYMTTSYGFIYQSEHFLDVTNDPQALQNSFMKMNLTFELGDEDGTWNAYLVGSNLTNEITSTFSGATTAVNGPLGGGGRYAFTEIGRTIALKLRLNF